ncbi:heterokaryon incompatibility protein-domain-containing protein [Circinella umbellata]|nr:heterokaryon incompatibility protein-domain-containing protein [Circinella umbellata]
MYITYYRNQKSIDLQDKTDFRLSLTGGEYRPTWLVRVSDWTVVPGSEASYGYHTLSYCWEQSGEIVERDDGGYDCIDEGDHCIVDGYNINEVDCTGIKRYLMRSIPPNKTTTSAKSATFEELIQQICKDFQVGYLWYDKACIDQANKKEKAREIRQMHKIYKNARYTLALVPELCITKNEDFQCEHSYYGNAARLTALNQISNSRWSKRSWTLEEVMMSRRILFVGADTNLFQHSLHTTTIPTTYDDFSGTLLDFGGRSHVNGTINQALHHAHFRTSTKPHDMVFALINTFAHLCDEIEINYSTDIQTTLNNFYRHIALQDLSILCFGSARGQSGSKQKQSTMGNYNLLSWTGVHGVHSTEPVNTATHAGLSYNIDNNMQMRITTKHWWRISIEEYSSYKKNRSVMKNMDDNLAKIYKARSRGIPSDMTCADKDTILNEWDMEISMLTSCWMTHFHEQKDGLLTQTRPLSLTENCEECLILPILFECYQPVYKHSKYHRSGVLYIERYLHAYVLPVFRECSDGVGRYKAIGVYLLGRELIRRDGKTMNWNHAVGRDDIDPNQSPQEILNILVENNCHSVPQEFIIE